MPSPIQTQAELVSHLQTAIQVEHATIPPYLTALYSIKSDPRKSNLASYNIIRAVLVEEMAHLTLAANLLNAVGGCPDLTRRDFVPDYPAYLPTGETDFEVGLQSFSRSAIDDFLKIERPAPPTTESVVEVEGVAYVRHELLAEGRKKGRGLLPHFRPNIGTEDDQVLHYWSIGEFYKAVAAGFQRLAAELPEETLFQGDPARQVGPEYYYSGGGGIFKVTDLDTALQAIDFISGQGEGSYGRIYDSAGELSHYYRFDQIRQERYYRVRTDQPDQPTGEALEVHWDEVYPTQANLKVATLPPGSELRQAANAFNEQYRGLLRRFEGAFNGKPAELIPAVGDMFRVRDAALRLIHNPLPSGEGNASPTFEMNSIDVHS
jgi:hypothetical protein